MAINKRDIKDRKNQGRNGLMYLEAFRLANWKLLDNWHHKDASQHAINKFKDKLTKQEILALRHKVKERGECYAKQRRR